MNAVWIWLDNYSIAWGTCAIVAGLLFTLTYHDTSKTTKIINFFFLSIINAVIICFAILYIFLFAANT